jgi:hypothetical protein
LNWHGLAQWEQWTISIGGSLGAAVIAWWLKKFFGKRRESRQATIQQYASPVMTQSFDPIINIHPAAAAAPSPTAPAIEPAPSATPVQRKEGRPNLRSEEVREWRFKVDERNIVTDCVGAGYYGYFAAFHNAPGGEETSLAERAFARIKYYGRGVRIEQPQTIDYGCWLNESTYSVDIPVGHTRELCLAVSKGLGDCHVLANKRQFYDGGELYRPTIGFALDKRAYDVEVELIYGEENPDVYHFWFELSTSVNPQLRRLGEPSWETTARRI